MDDTSHHPTQLSHTEGGGGTSHKHTQSQMHTSDNSFIKANIYIMKNLLSSFNVLIFVFFGCLCITLGAFFGTNNDAGITCFILLALFTIVLTMLKLMTKVVHQDHKQDVECYESQIKTLSNQLRRWQNGEMK